VREDCWGTYDFGIYEESGKLLMLNFRDLWPTKSAAVRNAKAMAKRIGLKYDDEIIKQS